MKRQTVVHKTVLLACLMLLCQGCSKQAPEHEHVSLDQGVVKIPLRRINDGGVHFFTYQFDGKNVNFFIRTDGEGHLQAHFDACYSCFKYKLGYVWRREKNQVVCIACQIGYDLKDVLWDYVGACAPINLKSRVQGDFLVIDQSHLEKGGRFF